MKWRENLPEKVVSLVVAVVMTMYVQAQLHPVIDRYENVRLELINRSNAYDVSLPENQIRVTLRGIRDQVQELNMSQIRAIVNLNSAKLGTNRLPVEMRYPSDWSKTIEVNPHKRFITVELVQRATRRLPVQVIPQGTPPIGHAVSDIRVEPETVSLSGPADAVRSVRRIVIPFDLTDVEGDLEMDMVPLLENKEGNPIQGLQLNPDQVRVKVRLISQPSSKTVPISLQWSVLPPFPYRLKGYSAQPAQVRLSGDLDQLRSLSVIETEPISLAEARSDMTLRVPLKVPPGIKVEGDAQIRVRLQVERTAESMPNSRGTDTPRTNESNPSRSSEGRTNP